MTREIKFRAWNGMNMEYAAGCSKYGCFYTAPDPLDTASLTTTLYDKETPVMQFTGLKDKNGIDIYEGDIVRDDPYISGVVFNQELAIFEAKGIALFLGRVEVIGNIYENKELLK